jgi:hypothetical protein
LLSLHRKHEDDEHLQRHIPGAVIDTSGFAMAALGPGKRGRGLQLQLQYCPVGREPKAVVVIDPLDAEVDRKCVRLLFGPSGLVFYFFSPLDVVGLQHLKPRMALLRFRSAASKRRLVLKKSVAAETGTEALQRELMTLSSDLSVDELMLLVKLAREKAQKKQT